MNSGDTAWILISAALLFLGMVSVKFILIGYTMAFGADVSGLTICILLGKRFPLPRGFMATAAVNPAGANALFYGETNLFFAQVISIGVAVIFAAVDSTVLYKIVNAIVALRASADEEITGLDLTEHGERGYNAGLFAGAPSFVNSFESDAVKFFPSVSSSQSCGGEHMNRKITKIDIITRPSKLEDLKDALNKIGVHGMTVSRVYAQA